MYYELVYVFIQLINKSDKLLFVKKDCLQQGWALEKSLRATKFGPGPLYIYFNIYYNALYIHRYLFVWHRGPQLALEHPSAHPCTIETQFALFDNIHGTSKQLLEETVWPGERRKK